MHIRLVERDWEVRTLCRAYNESESGHGQVVVVSGAITVGKSALVHAFVEQMQDRGVRVLSAVCGELERDLPLGVIEQLFRQVRAHTGVGVDRLPEPAGGDPGTITPEQVTIVAELAARLLDEQDQGPLLITVDDIQHADPLSLHCLLHLVRRLRTTRITLVLTESARRWSGHPLFNAELLRHPHCQWLRLAPLSVDGVAQLLADRLGEAAGAADDHHRRTNRATRMHAATGGNPLLVEALATDQPAIDQFDEDGPDVRSAAGRGFEIAVNTVLHRCPPLVRSVARGIAVLGGHGSQQELARLLEVGSEDVADAVYQLAGAGLLDGERFRLSVTAGAVLAAMPSAARARLHARLARIRHQAGAPVELVAQDLLTAGLPPPPWAVDLLADASGAALAERDFDRATRCLELAITGETDQRRQADLRMSLASIAWETNLVALADHLDPLADAAHLGMLAPQHLSRLARYLLWAGRADDVTRLLHRHGQVAQAEAGSPASEPSTTSPALLVPPTMVESQTALLPSEWVEALSAFTSVLAGAGDDAPARAEQLLRGVRFLDAGTDPVVWSLLTLVYSDQVEKAEMYCADYLGQAREWRISAASGRLSAVHSTIALRLGDLATAEQAAQSSLAHLSVPAWGIAAGLPVSLLMRALTARGNYDAAAKTLRRTLPDIAGQGHYAVHYVHARAHFYLATGCLEAARRDFIRCGELMAKWHIDNLSMTPWRSDLAEVEVLSGRPDRAAELAEAQLDRAGTRSPRARGLALRQLAATCELPQRAAQLREAVELLQSVGDRYELAKALGDLSSTLHLLGESQRARLVARRAWHAARESGAEPLLRALAPAAEPVAAGDTDAPVDSKALSEAEHRVGALATLGYSNREIARKLYITVSTVEQHLTRVYRKLDVQSRADLPASLQLAVADLY